MILPDESVPMETGIDHPPLEFPPAIDPVFWGTGDLLTWDVANLLQSIDKKHLFRKIWALDALSDGEYARVSADVFEPAFSELANLLSTEEMVVPRGFYGFFPVITDKMSIVVLDPSDFHSELLSIPCPQARKLGGRSLADFFRPEGDVLAVSAVTLGPSIDRCMQRMEMDSANAKKVGFLRGIGTTMLDTLIRKITVEVRRGLGIDVATGHSFTVNSSLVGANCFSALFEVLGFEERLGIKLTGFDQCNPVFSSIQLLVHHPQINDFVHFGT